ncbi:alkaline phosphatase [Kocuria palustris]|uniref:alkaline phosphatase D family protein n=1 Tax=Kocuria palustris TaxID=71999 RepID=UPI001642972C|nr:alkaline phosphatase D family protein [Kocuria palustris]
MASLSRRGLLSGTAAATAVLSTAAVPATASPAAPVRAERASVAGLVRSRLHLPSGIMTGEASTDSVVVWSRSSADGRMVVRITAVDEDFNPVRGRGGFEKTVESGWVTAETDHTVKIGVTGLPSGSQFLYAVQFEDEDGVRSPAEFGTFRTAPEGLRLGRGQRTRRASGTAQSFVWTADTAGQGWGINPDLGGMRTYRAMAATNPDFFIHAGDTIYADGPIEAEVEEPGGQLWRNVVTEGVSKVAETQEEFRARHRYNMMDHNIREFYANTSLYAQWDDHETTNNWWPGEVLSDDRYTVRDVDTLAARGRRAWQEYQPIGDARALEPGTSGFEDARIYRRISRGSQLDVFCLDMRTHKSENTDGMERAETDILGEEQTRWLIDGLRDSTATWKCISADLPFGLVVPDGQAQESISNDDPNRPLGRELQLARVLKSIKDNGVKNVFVITGDVHYCAAHRYRPQNAAFKEFDEFWEFVAGPINAGCFGPNELDGTFGPEEVFVKAGPREASPRDMAFQFFGHVDLDEQDLMTVSLRDGNGEIVWEKEFEPQR